MAQLKEAAAHRGFQRVVATPLPAMAALRALHWLLVLLTRRLTGGPALTDGLVLALLLPLPILRLLPMLLVLPHVSHAGGTSSKLPRSNLEMSRVGLAAPRRPR
jgi:Mn2+/Fe2+ NRAMP family transporter